MEIKELKLTKIAYKYVCILIILYFTTVTFFYDYSAICHLHFSYSLVSM